MNKKEAIQTVDEGQKVTHKLFSEDEYICRLNDDLCDENNLLLGEEFWNLRTHDTWDDGWELYSKLGEVP